jgi:hypothetical protein
MSRRHGFIFWLAALLSALHVPSHAHHDQPVALYCARGVPDYPDAAMTLNNQGTHVVHVTFVGFRPSKTRADWSLRDCLSTAAKLDGSRDIVAWLWYRERYVRGPGEMLRPYGGSQTLVYKASQRNVVVQTLQP